MAGQNSGFFSKLVNSTAGFSNYKHFIKEKSGKAVLYLLLLTLVLGVVSLIRPALDYNNVINEVILRFDKEVPDFTFENGKLNVSGNLPIIISDEGYTMIIDTSGQTDQTILDNYDTVILVMKDKMIQKNYTNLQVTNFSLFQGFSTNKESVRKLLPIMKWGTAFIIVFGIIFFIAAKYISALLLSLIGMIINALMRANLPYGSIFRFSAYSMTLPLILGTLLDLVFGYVPYFWIVFYLISAVYIWGAVKAVRNDDDSLNNLPE